MDALKCIKAMGDPSKNISDAQAIRLAVAEQIRDLADEIEKGVRCVSEMTTFEMAQAGQNPQSILNLKTFTVKLPASMVVPESSAK